MRKNLSVKVAGYVMEPQNHKFAEQSVAMKISQPTSGSVVSKAILRMSRVSLLNN